MCVFIMQFSVDGIHSKSKKFPDTAGKFGLPTSELSWVLIDNRSEMTFRLYLEEEGGEAG